MTKYREWHNWIPATEVDRNILKTKPEPGAVLDYFTYNSDFGGQDETGQSLEACCRQSETVGG